MKRILPHRVALLFSVCLLVAAAASAQEQSVRPGINRAYEDPDLERAIRNFEAEGREIFRHRHEIVDLCELKPGMDVADIGAGTGLFTRLFAAKVRPEGKVYAVDISEKFVDHIEKTCREEKLDNVVGIVCTDRSTKLPPCSVDVVFICDTYHHFEYPQKTLASIHQALRPGGRLVVIDFKKEKGVSPEWVFKHVRGDKQTTIQEITAAGFTLIDSPELMEQQYVLRFVKSKPSEYFELRSKLDNCRIRFLREKQGRVAFLGGSITKMDGWRPMVAEALKRRFPATQFDFVDAAIPSTDSTLGAFRLGTDVFGRGPVDLLFVEFAVNDHHNARGATERIRGMEGIVRQARQRNPAIDIVILYFVEPDKMADYNQGRVPAEIESHEQVAEHYGIISVDLAREVTARINAGEFTWADFRDLHPSPFGHRIYTNTIERLFDAVWSQPLPDDARLEPHPLPADPLDPRNYGGGRYVGIEEARLEQGWRHDPSWTASDAGTRAGFVRVPMLVADQPGAVLTLDFAGTAVGLLVVAGPDVGVLEYRIDGGPWKSLDQFTQWSPRLHIPWAYILDADLKPGQHTLTLRTAADKNPASRGHACRIVKFLVNESAGIPQTK